MRHAVSEYPFDTPEIAALQEGQSFTFRFKVDRHEIAVQRWRHGYRPQRSWWRQFFSSGRHHWGPSDLSPVGQVWFHDGIWWTFCRARATRVPRMFADRSNPLDHDWAPREPGKPRTRWEVEY